MEVSKSNLSTEYQFRWEVCFNAIGLTWDHSMYRFPTM